MDRSVATTELYDALAPIYDAWQSASGMTPFALVAEAKLRPLLEQEAGGGDLAYLDLGCGTGTLLHALAARHPRWRLAGADASGAMLAVAAAKPAPRAEAITWRQAQLDQPLPFDQRFDVAGAFYDTLNHLTDPAALARALAAAAAVLRPGGLFVFDLTNRLGFERWWRGQSDFRAPGWRLTIDARFEPRPGVGLAAIRVVHGTRVARLRFMERLFDENEVVRLLADAGLVLERKEPWSPFDSDVPGKTWWVARKK